MISFHPLKNGADYQYARNWRVADTNDIERLKIGICGHVWSPCVWTEGRRKEEYFLRADWCVLDFDSPEMTLEEAVKLFCDTVHIIGTTRNHQRAKKGLTCDRFRVLILFERAVEVLADYRHTMATAVQRYPVDPSPKDGARFFYPCRDIVSASAEGFTEPVLIAPPFDPRASFGRYHQIKFGILPFWLDDFLTKGRLCRVGRNQTVYAAAIAMRDLGISAGDIYRRIAQAPIDRTDFSDREMQQTIANGLNRKGSA